MALDKQQVKSIAYLARLGVDDANLEEYADELSQVLELVEQLNAADTDNIAPMAHPTHATTRLRADVVTETDQRDRLMQPAPLTENGLFLVPKVIE